MRASRNRQSRRVESATRPEGRALCHTADA